MEATLPTQLYTHYSFSFQQKRQIQQWADNCNMWQEKDFFSQIPALINEVEAYKSHWNTPQKRDFIFQKIEKAYHFIQSKAKSYKSSSNTQNFPKYRYEDNELKGHIFKNLSSSF